MMKNLDPSDEDMLNQFQRAAFNYFLGHANPENGLVADKSTPGAPASIAAVGFGLSACAPGNVVAARSAREFASDWPLVWQGSSWKMPTAGVR